MSMRTRVLGLKTVELGDAIGYNQRFRATRRTRVALLPAGYSDGYPHRLSNRGHVLVRGRRAPVIGAVTMDYAMADVTDVPEVAVGDGVTLWGEGLRVEELARKIGSIPYEITCRLGRRVKRIYRTTRRADAAA